MTMSISGMAMFYELDGRFKHEFRAKTLSLLVSEFDFCWLFASLDSSRLEFLPSLFTLPCSPVLNEIYETELAIYEFLYSRRCRS